MLENMEKMMSQMKSGNMQGAQKCSKSAQSSLSEMIEMLNQAKKGMVRRGYQKLADGIRNDRDIYRNQEIPRGAESQ